MAEFDIDGARAAGITDTAIADDLATKVGFDIVGARNAGHNDKDIADSLAGKFNSTRRLAAAPKTWWQAFKEQAHPDIFKTEEASRALSDKIFDQTGSPELAGLTNVAANAVSMGLGGGIGAVIGTGVKKMGKEGGRWLMQTAVKPLSSDLASGKGARAIDFMLTEGRNVTEGGIRELRTEGIEIANKVKKIIANSRQGVPTGAVENRLLQLADEVSYGTHGVQHTKDVMKELKVFLDHPEIVYSGTPKLGSLSAQSAQRMKQANYRELDEAAYGIGAKTDIEQKSLKAINRELKIGLEKIHPEVIPLNKRASEIWNAVNVSERRALLEGNKNMLSLPLSLAVATNNPGLALGVWLNQSAWGKSFLARGLFSGAELAVPIGTVLGTYGGGIPHTDRLRAEMMKIFEDGQTPDQSGVLTNPRGVLSNQ